MGLWSSFFCFSVRGDLVLLESILLLMSCLLSLDFCLAHWSRLSSGWGSLGLVFCLSVLSLCLLLHLVGNGDSFAIFLAVYVRCPGLFCAVVRWVVIAFRCRIWVDNCFWLCRGLGFFRLVWLLLLCSLLFVIGSFGCLLHL